MRRAAVGLAVLMAAGAWAAGAGAANPSPPPERVARIEILSPQRLPTDLVHTAIGDLTGRPLSRLAVRQSLDRLWALGLFSEAWVDEVPEAGGIRLRFHLVRRPYVRSIAWEGDAGLSTADLAVAAGLALDGDAGPDQLESARRRLLAAYAKEGFFAARVEARAREEQETNARDITFVLQAGSPARIDGVTLSGVAGEQAEALAKSLGLDAGDRYREEAVRARVRSAEETLRQDGFFEARLTLQPPAWDPASNRVRLVIEVRQGARYRVEFDGNQALKAPILQEHLTFANAGIVDDAEVAASARQIEAAYRDAGYHFARASGVLEGKDPNPRIRFEIIEGPPVVIEAIAFSGNRTFPAGRLRGLMETRLPGPFQRGLFRQEILDRDVLVLLAFYRSQGFPDAAVGPPEVTFSADRQRARISIPVVEGPRLRLGRVTIVGARVLTTEKILRALPLTSGSPWVASQVEDARRLVERRYERRGYLHARITSTTDREGDRMSVTLRIQEGSETRVGRILVSGLVLTREEVVRREIPFHAGDPFDPEALLEVERRLTVLGIFERVQVGPLQPPPASFADVEVTLKEGKPWRVDFGGGYSTDQQWRGLLEIGHDNLFGTGRSASIRESLGTKGDRTDATFRDPRVLGTEWRGDFAALRTHTTEIGYKQEKAGGSAGIERDLWRDQIRGLRGALRYRLDWVRLFGVDPSLAAADIVAGSQVVASLTPALTLDRRDNVIAPKRGSLHFLSLEVGGSALGSEVNFLKSRLDSFWYLDWLPPTTIVLSGRIGLATPLGDTPALAVGDRFFAGGGSTIRGYREHRVGPRDASGNPTGGNALLLANVEWRFPIWRWFSGALFVDSGAVTPAVGDLGDAAFRTGVGAGLRVNTPVGPLRLDVGYALNRIPGNAPWQLYFSIGFPF